MRPSRRQRLFEVDCHHADSTSGGVLATGRYPCWSEPAPPVLRQSFTRLRGRGTPQCKPWHARTHARTERAGRDQGGLKDWITHAVGDTLTPLETNCASLGVALPCLLEMERGDAPRTRLQQ